jgi:asparagine synthase (glutamine-hydrolysing)
MCGIAGAIGPLSPKLLGAVQQMSARLGHRGPDAEGFWTSPDRRVAFGHRRLAIIDLSDDGRQPMTDPETGTVIIFNGEIYNYLQLRDELARLGHRFHTRTDTEVILKGYQQWGTGCVSHLRGMFAIALRDGSSGRILLARDRVGIKPLYYVPVSACDGTSVLFASEVRALLETGLVQRRTEPVALASYLWNGFVAGDSSIIRGVNQFPAGSFAVLDPARPCVEPKWYWHLPTRSHRPSADTEPVRAALQGAVGQHLVSDVPLGVFLSGGIDSSAVAALASRAGSGRIQTFNVSFDESTYDESAYARQVAEQLGAEHHDLRLTQRTFKDHLDDALNSLDQPTFDAINTYFVSRIVRQTGTKVALAGTGGDELFGGYRTFAELPLVRRVARLCRFLPAAAVRAAAVLATRVRSGCPGEVPPQTRWGKLSDVLTAGSELLDLYQSAYGLFTRDFLGQLSSWSSSTALRSGLPADWAARLQRLIAEEGDLEAISTLELACFLGERLLRDTDAVSMAVSLEVRVPYLDHVLIEALAALDVRTRFQPLGDKRLLRRLALKDLDPTIFDRPKSGFELPLDIWCRDSLLSQITDAFADRVLCESVGLNSAAVTRLLRAFLAGAPGMSWSRIWSLFVLLWWSRRHRVTR